MDRHCLRCCTAHSYWATTLWTTCAHPRPVSRLRRCTPQNVWRRPSARFLWKRLPLPCKQNQELCGVWEIGKHLWTRQYPQAFEYIAANSVSLPLQARARFLRRGTGVTVRTNLIVTNAVGAPAGPGFSPLTRKLLNRFAGTCALGRCCVGVLACSGAALLMLWVSLSLPNQPPTGSAASYY
eukprot:COSAG01_NODE_1737_length_9362_cov_165.799309_9_plen_182_part_00